MKFCKKGATFNLSNTVMMSQNGTPIIMKSLPSPHFPFASNVDRLQSVLGIIVLGLVVWSILNLTICRGLVRGPLLIEWSSNRATSNVLESQYGCAPPAGDHKGKTWTRIKEIRSQLLSTLQDLISLDPHDATATLGNLRRCALQSFTSLQSLEFSKHEQMS